MKMIKVICEICGEEFEKNLGKFNESKKKKWKLFCSEGCLSKSRRKEKILLYCEECGEGILRSQKEINRSKTKNFFCSSGCAAIYNNKKYPKRKKIRIDNKDKKLRGEKNKKDIAVYYRCCLNCGEDLPSRRPRKYCDSKCQQEHKYKCFLEDWFSGKHNGGRGKEGISIYIIRFLREKYEDKCQKCGWGEINLFTGEVPLDVHHVDGDWKNNKLENLELLCLNCHGLTKNYRNSGKNRKNKGRSGKRDFYNKHKSSRWIKTK
jgi:hypothetical protein